MGIYINPEYCSKEQFLNEKGVQLTHQQAEKWSDFNQNLLVVLIDNTTFTAAGIAFDNGERDALLMPDKRSRTFWKVNIVDLLNVSKEFSTYRSASKKDQKHFSR